MNNKMIIHVFGQDKEVTFLGSHKGRNIVEEDSTIMVHDPKWNTLFIVCMDDSKMAGKRMIDESSNTTEAAVQYIDATTD